MTVELSLLGLSDHWYNKLTVELSLLGLSDYGHQLLPGQRNQPSQDRVQPEPGEGPLHVDGGGHLPRRPGGRLHGRLDQTVRLRLTRRQSGHQGHGSRSTS